MELKPGMRVRKVRGDDRDCNASRGDIGIVRQDRLISLDNGKMCALPEEWEPLEPDTEVVTRVERLERVIKIIMISCSGIDRIKNKRLLDILNPTPTPPKCESCGHLLEKK